MKNVLASMALLVVLGGPSGYPARAATRPPLSETGAAFLDVSSDPVAKILIDEVDTGRVTPEAHLEVKSGRHKLTLVTLDGARQRTLGFTIEPGQTRKFTVHLAR